MRGAIRKQLGPKIGALLLHASPMDKVALPGLLSTHRAQARALPDLSRADESRHPCHKKLDRLALRLPLTSAPLGTWGALVPPPQKTSASKKVLLADDVDDLPGHRIHQYDLVAEQHILVLRGSGDLGRRRNIHQRDRHRQHGA